MSCSVWTCGTDLPAAGARAKHKRKMKRDPWPASTGTLRNTTPGRQDDGATLRSRKAGPKDESILVALSDN
jgi:hypothetical protein